MAYPERQPRRWTSTEDQILREQVEAQQAEGGGADWCQIALALPGRTNKDCRKRWYNSVAEGLKKGQWSSSEDRLLIRGVHRYGSQWTKVATCVSSRSADQCAKRWQQSLDPCLDRSEWRKDEDVALLQAVDRLGRHWKDIQQQHLPHRSKNCIKNRYSVLARRTASSGMPYEDNLGSSPSDPGTPLQLEVGSAFDFTPMQFLDDTAQVIYMQTQMSQTSGNEFSLASAGLDDANIPITASHYEPSGARSCPTYPSLHYSQSQWDFGQTALGSQHPVQCTTSSIPLMQGNTFSPHQQPMIPTAFFYATAPTQSPQPTAPLMRPSGSFTQGQQVRYIYRDAVPGAAPDTAPDTAPFGHL